MKQRTTKLGRNFFTREDVLAVSRELLGKYLVTNIDGQQAAGRIVEVEAYRGPDDKASHAYNNRHTARTNALGEARVSLLPGTYIVTVLECPLTLALPDPDTVEVVSGQRQVLRQECDTGIR